MLNPFGKLPGQIVSTGANSRTMPPETLHSINFVTPIIEGLGDEEGTGEGTGDGAGEGLGDGELEGTGDGTGEGTGDGTGEDIGDGAFEGT